VIEGSQASSFDKLRMTLCGFQGASSFDELKVTPSGVMK